jgi:hypothetical protein
MINEHTGELWRELALDPAATTTTSPTVNDVARNL